MLHALAQGGVVRHLRDEAGRIVAADCFTRDGHRLADCTLGLFRRLKRRQGADMPDAEVAAEAFLNLLGGSARNTAWGMAPDQAEIDRQTRYRVGLFIHGAFSQ